MKKIILFSLICLLALTSNGWRQTTIVNYDFNSGTADNNLTPALATNISATFTSTATWATSTGTASGGSAFTSFII